MSQEFTPEVRSPAADVGFEQALEQLEQRVRQLESGEVSLEDALRLYEEGVSLARTCQDLLEAAEKRVALLTRGPRGVEEKDLPGVG